MHQQSSPNVSITQIHFFLDTPCWVQLTTCKGPVRKYKSRHKYKHKYKYKNKHKYKDAPVSHDIAWCATHML